MLEIVGRESRIRVRRAMGIEARAANGVGTNDAATTVAGVPWQLPWQHGAEFQPAALALWRQQQLRLPRQQAHLAGAVFALPVRVSAGARGERHSNSSAAMRRAATVLLC